MNTKPTTFSIQTLDDKPGLWLCAENIFTNTTTPIAEFLTDEARLLFTQVLANAIQVAHAKGAMGI